MMDPLPMELQVEILLKMPVKSLYRFRCVSKTFLNAIDSPLFTRRHTRSLIAGHNIGGVPQLICLGQTTPYATLQTLRYNGANLIKDKFSRNYKSLGNYWNPIFMIKFVFHNLVCMDLQDGSCMLIDPIRDQHISLPVDELYTRHNLHYIDYSTWYGMGFDDITNTYKIVRVSKICDYRNSRNNALLVHIHTLGVGTTIWREIPSHPPTSLLIRHAVCAYGDMHWLTRRKTRCTIVSFDFKTETFHRTPTPPTLMSSKKTSVSFLITLRGYMTIVVTTFPSRKETTEVEVEIWMMKDYSKKEWVREYNMNVNMEPLHRFRNGTCGEWEHGIYFSDPYMDHDNTGGGAFRYFLDITTRSVVEIPQWLLDNNLFVDLKSYRRSFILLQDFCSKEPEC